MCIVTGLPLDLTKELRGYTSKQRCVVIVEMISRRYPEQSFLPFSAAWVLVFLLSRAAKPVSSTGSVFSASSPNSIFITTSSLFRDRNEVKKNVTFGQFVVLNVLM